MSALALLMGASLLIFVVGALLYAGRPHPPVWEVVVGLLAALAWLEIWAVTR